MARARARDDDAVGTDAPVYEYMEARGLDGCWESPGFGVLGPDMNLPEAIRYWPRDGYRLVLPLFNQTGQVSSLQGRSIRRRVVRKVLFPARSAVRGCLFANELGKALLRGRLRPRRTVLMGEGLTDFLAIACAAPGYAVLAVPGTGFAKTAVGQWAAAARVVVAMDNDEAGAKSTDVVAPLLYGAGAKEVLRVTWPLGCGDACDVVQRAGMIGLETFIREQMREMTAR